MSSIVQIASAVLHSPYFQYAVAGALVAARTDYQAFAAMHSFKDVEGYSWNIASFRWVQGAVIGIVSHFAIATVGLS